MKFDDEDGEWEPADWREDLLGFGCTVAVLVLWVIFALWGISAAFPW